MRVGTIGYATDQGLGILIKALYDHDIITDMLVVKHCHHHTHAEWYPNSQIVDYRNREAMVQFCKSMDRMVFVETPFHWNLLDSCRVHNIPTYLIPMYECMPDPLPREPDVFVCLSDLDYKIYGGAKLSFILTFPVDVKWKLRDYASTFVHNAGHLGLKGRNGTLELLQAIPLVKSDANFIIRGQDHQFRDLVSQFPELRKDSRVRFVFGNLQHHELWEEGDVFLFPEKFNGLSLPLQEAYAAGMLVMCGARYPMTNWLPTEPLIPVHSYSRIKVGGPYREIDSANIRPEDIASSIDAWFGKSIEYYSRLGKVWGNDNRWSEWAATYKGVFHS